MPRIQLPEPGRPYVLVEPADEQDILEIARDEIIALYKAHGALLFSGFGADLDHFSRFARKFCATSVQNESPGRQPLDPEHNVHTVDAGSGAFSLHPELSREPWKPDVAFFGCLSAPTNGGATTICDGVELVRQMPDAVRRGLEHRRLLYIKPTWPSLLEFWLSTPNPTDAQLAAAPPSCPYSFHRIEGDIIRVFTRPALHRPMFIDAPAFGNFLLFARFNHGRPNHPLLDDGELVPESWLQAIKATGDRLSTAIQWRKGDVLMVDNTRFMHGRTAITDPGERLIATYFGYLDFALPDPEEPPDAPWRHADFTPPLRPDHPLLATISGRA